MIAKLLKLIAINIAVFIGLLIALNCSAILIYQGLKLVKPVNTEISNDIRGELPNYNNTDWAHKHFKECKEVPAEYRSYIGWRRLPYKGDTISINEQGIRNTPQSELATAKSPLVVFLGGSTMWGTGANDANTIPALFAKIAQGRYRTINFGESGYNAFQGHLFLQLQIINGLVPDIVVSYDGVNNLSCLKSGISPFGHARETQIRSVMKGVDRAKNRKDEEALSFSHFFIDPLKSFISQFKNKYDDDSAENNAYDLGQEKVKQAAEFLLESWLSTRDLAEKHGAKYFAVLQPSVVIGKPYLDHLKLSMRRAKHYKLFYPAVLKLLQSPKYQELSNNVIVLTDVFDQENCIYIDAVHVSPNGNNIIATKIYNHITNSIYNIKKE